MSTMTCSRRLKFFFWGIRYFSLVFTVAFPSLGAIMAIGAWDLKTLARFFLFDLCNALFVMHIYTFNDWAGGTLNPHEPQERSHHALKDGLLRPSQVLGVSVCLGVLSLIGYGLWFPRTLWLILFMEIITSSYSHPRINLKGRPVVGILIHFLGASAFFIAGWEAFAPLEAAGICMGAYFGLVLAAAHFSHEVIHMESDLAGNVRTNAAVFGPRASFRAGLILFIASSAFFVFVARRFLASPLTTYLASAVLCMWAVQTWRYWNWEESQSLHGFRRFWLKSYAIIALLMVVIRFLEI